MFRCYSDSCSKVQINSSIGDIKYITSPRYPEAYPSSHDCTWFLQSRDQSSTYVIRILNFYTEYTYDNFYIGIGTSGYWNTTVVRIHAQSFPSSVIIPKQAIWLRFISDVSVQYPGFLLQVEQVKGREGNFMSIIFL